MELNDIGTGVIPMGVVLVGTGVIAAASSRMRAILGEIFRRPRQTSVVISVGDKTIVYHDATSVDVNRVIEALKQEHAESQRRDSPPDGPNGGDNTDGDEKSAAT
ncbi:hypothetical protein [Rhodococcus koreensis]